MTKRTKLLLGLGGVIAALAALRAIWIFAMQQISAEEDRERYAAYSAWIREGLTGESHSLGSAEGVVAMVRKPQGARTPAARILLLAASIVSPASLGPNIEGVDESLRSRSPV